MSRLLFFPRFFLLLLFMLTTCAQDFLQSFRYIKRSTELAFSRSAGKLYGSPKEVNERHRHRYEVNKEYVPQLEEAGLKFVGTDENEDRMEIVELDNHPYYVAVQFHPEYLSRPLKPSPPFMGLILASIGKLKGYLNKGLRLSPRQISDNSSGIRRFFFRFVHVL